MHMRKDQIASSRSIGNTLTALAFEVFGASTADLTLAPLLALLREADWLPFCSLVHRLRLAPLCYERLRTLAPPIVPSDVLEWFRTQYYTNVARNLVLLDELERITNRFAQAGIVALTLKGPVIAHVGCGLRTRVFNDLDLLVNRDASGAVATIMADLGYAEVPGDSHPFHVSYYSGTRRWLPLGVEMHFDVVDRSKPFLPDLAGIWERSQTISIDGLAVPAPSLMDHLLLMIIQLPTHLWALRLLLDVAFLTSRNAIDWDEVLERARAWQIRVLTGSALHVVASLLNGQLPEAARDFAVPEGYVQRVQWRIVRAAVLEFLDGALVLSRLAPLVVADNFHDTRLLVEKKRTISANSSAIRSPYDFRRLLALSIHAAPALLPILLGSWARESSDSLVGGEVVRR